MTNMDTLGPAGGPMSRRSGDRAIVTGAAGFLGSHLCQRLLAMDMTVVGIDNLCTGAAGNLAGFREHPHFTFLPLDVAVPFAVSGPVEVVFHLASPASPVDYRRLGLGTLAAGAFGTWHALQVAERAGARLVLASTSEVYGDPVEHPQRESYNGNVNPVGPRSVYDEAKRYAEALTAAFRRDHGVDTGIVRIFNTYGPRMRADDGRAVPEFIRRAVAGLPIAVTGTGSQTRSMCFVSDMIDGLVAMGSAGGVAGPVNLGNPDELTILGLAKTIVDLCGSTSSIQFESRPVDDPERRCPDISRARETLGWAPHVDLREGLLTTIAAARRARRIDPADQPLEAQ